MRLGGLSVGGDSVTWMGVRMMVDGMMNSWLGVNVDDSPRRERASALGFWKPGR